MSCVWGLIWFAIALSGAASGTGRYPCHRALTEDISTGTKLKNGSIIAGGITYDRGKYYYEDSTHIRGCVCEYQRCFRKCCPIGKAYYNRTCTDTNNTVANEFDIGIFNKTDRVSVPPGYFRILTNNFCDNGRYLLEPDVIEKDRFHLQHDGQLLQPAEKSIYHPPELFCLEYFEHMDNISALVCFGPQDEESGAIYSIGMMISMPFLIVTFLVYAAIPELRNLHGKCLMCYCASLFVAYVFLVSVQLGRAVINVEFCIAAPFIIYFSFMVSFLWLNVMCVDIWLTFSGRRGFIGSSARQSEQKRFFVYSCYAWGIPLIMTGIVAIMQFADIPTNLVRPEFGTGKCWFLQDKALGLYFYGPIMLIILGNVFLFVWTTYKIYQVKKETERSMRHESQRHSDDNERQRYKLYMKLMMVFGVNWSMEIISWLAGGPKWLWITTDLCNALYGVFIFFIFVCKVNIWKLTKKRYHSFMGRSYKAHSMGPSSSVNTRSTDTSTMSHGPESYSMDNGYNRTNTS